ncbi:tRNA (adenosine(37)-N6)-threonylcarbamoyltransferase complex ATPase subunit type 1 TsaE [Phaeocystidibacter luteus]|uniref:tRNA threonylcarbamoyladenosine biosynthesis protein TsaE n=1 Tax=Phaeocystidibacter luteus TaxID=911197 RepID=A0A6N6RGI0_9FLAO|nr:tRNA (adenosine(37)-N6)-threonylcarbamoyltransferase complex ATPase subunit type 1 TsaE [Phaeocystidibacter luteus]KAB2810289.1 tRNA (adenosine(37)-N6)-threonylcarbamoyltransferase complex ATPase subunit type 1 TsaE [Phaeocystidibacter luteus]
MQFEAKSLEDLKQLAPVLAELIPKGVVLFQGDMGAGKTTTISALCEAWGVVTPVQSPTFSLVNEYETLNGETIFHFDFYRLEDEEEAMDMGYEDYFWSGNRCLVEWPEKIPTLLPKTFTLVRISVSDGIRTIQLRLP